jgi:protein translocase SecG subunit
MMAFLGVLLTIVFFLVCLLIVLIVLVQPHHGEGLATAFGGSSGDSFFGTKAVSAAARITIVLGATYAVLALILNAGPMRQPRTVVQTGTETPKEEKGGGELPKDDQGGTGTDAPKESGSSEGTPAEKDAAKEEKK